jgi:hypothetical protein
LGGGHTFNLHSFLLALNLCLSKKFPSASKKVAITISPQTPEMETLLAGLFNPVPLSYDHHQIFCCN